MFGAATPAFGATPGFGAAGTPAFGAASTASLFGAASSAAATGFGQSAPAFGAAASPFAASTPAFGGASTSLFGAASTPGLFGAASTPGLFGAASTPSLFGAASTPSLFGAAPATGGGLFGAAASTPSLFGAAAPAAVAPGGQQAVTALTTKDGRPITHASKWDDLSPQTQQYLTELEKVVVQYREDCRQLDADPRLSQAGGAAAGTGSGAREQQEAMQGQARSLSQAISALGSTVKSDVEQVAALREAVLYLVRSTDTALHTFKRTHAWREAAKASTPMASPADIAGPPVLPSAFLREAIAGFLERLKQHQAAVAELEAVLLGGGNGQRRGNGGAPTDGLQALQGALTNVHDCLIHTAARLQALDDRVTTARESYLARQRAAGDASDPFEEEERRQARRAEHQPRSPASQAAALHAAQHQHQQHAGAAAPAASPGMAPAHTTTTFGASPAQTPAASPGGLFGTVQPSPAGAFGTPFGQAQQQRSAPSSRKPSSRRR